MFLADTAARVPPEHREMYANTAATRMNKG